MIFGQNPKYLFGEIFKEKFSTPEKAYKIDPVMFECDSCPAKVVGESISLFFANPIFNTLAESVEENVTILRSYDTKRTIIKQKLLENKLYTVRIINETDKLREVELYQFDSFFPGFRTKARIELVDGKPIARTSLGTGQIRFQNNEERPEVECLLYKIEDGTPYFVEVDNPVERCKVTVVKDLKKNKLVENGSIKGILVGSKNTVKEGEEVDVYAYKVNLGSYIFIEDIRTGPAVVELVGREGSAYLVKCCGFTGKCYDKEVNKRMKGIITEIKGSCFIFVRDGARENETNLKDQNIKKPSALPPKTEQPAKAEQSAKTEQPAKRKTEEFEQVNIYKRVAVNSEKDVKNDQHRAIELIKAEISKDSNKNVMPLFNKFIMSLDKKDTLCLFYLKYLQKNNKLDREEVKRVLGITGPKFPVMAANMLEGREVLEQLFRKKKSKNCFIKLLERTNDKLKFAKSNKEFIESAVEYFYSHEHNPREMVDALVGKSFKGWLAYLKNESGAYKRGLFRRIVQAKYFKRNEMKEIFEGWLEFEEATGGNTEEVSELAKVYVSEERKHN